MPEGPKHHGLVRSILNYIETDLGGLKNLAVFDDTVAPLRGQRPPRINGFVPDVYASAVPPSFIIIGEAKTQIDLETPHTRDQLTSFIDHLATIGNGTLILATPWQATVTARTMVMAIQQSLGVKVQQVILLNELRCTTQLLAPNA